MSEPVVINLVSEGVAKLQAELRTIDQTIAEMERRSSRAAESGARQRTNTARAAANDQQRLWRDTAKQAEAWEKQKARIADNSARMAGQLAKRQADTEIKEADRAARDKLRATERAERERQRIIDNSARMAGRIGEREANAEIAAMKRAQEARARFMTGMAGKVGHSIAGVARGGLTMLGSATGIGAGYAVADAAREQLGLEREAANIAVSAYIPGKTERPSIDAIMARARAAEALTNIRSTDIAKGFHEYVGLSSDFSGGMENLPELAKLAKASGTDFGQLMQTAGLIRSQNDNMKPEQMMDMLRNVIGQGKIGSVEMRDLATIGGKITASSAMYQGNQAQTQAKLLGLAQLAAKTSGVELAPTTITDFGADVLKASRAGKLTGLTVTDAKSGLLADPAEILRQMFERAHGNLGALGEGKGGLGLGRRSIALAEAVAPVYQTAYQDAKKRGLGDGEATKYAGQAITAKVNEYTRASYSKGDVDTDFATVMQVNAEKFDTAVTRIRETLETQLAPVLQRAADKLPELMPEVESLIGSVGKMADWAAGDPMRAIVDVLLASIAKDAAGAALGASVKKLLESQIGATFASGVSILTAAITAEQVGEVIINKIADADAQRNKHEVGENIGATNAISGLRRVGGPKEQDIQNARRTLQELTATVDQQKEHADSFSHKATMFALGGGMMGAEATTKRVEEEQRAIKANEDALKALTKALNEATRAYGTQGAGGNPAGGSDHASRNVPLTNPARGGGH